MTRIAVRRAIDAPAATIVVDGSSWEPSTTRDDVRRILDDVRSRVLLRIPDEPRLGLKNIVVFRPVRSTMRVEFFQGEPYGPLDVASQEVCVNSAVCAAQAAISWGLIPAGPLTVLMGGCSFELRPAAGTAVPAAHRRA